MLRITSCDTLLLLTILTIVARLVDSQHSRIISSSSSPESSAEMFNLSTESSFDVNMLNESNQNAMAQVVEEAPDWSNESSNVITIGFIASFNLSYGMGSRIAGAIPKAVSDINDDPNILPNHRLQFIVKDEGIPNTAQGIQSMTELREQGAVAFIGLDNTCHSEALVAAAWNFPLITYKCAEQRVSDKSIYPTFARTLPPSRKVSKSLVALLKKFAWKRLVLVVSKLETDRQIEDDFKELAGNDENQINITETFYVSAVHMRSNEIELEKIIKQTYQRTRIYILLTNIYTLAAFASAMEKQNLMAKGEHVIISVVNDEMHNTEALKRCDVNLNMYTNEKPWPCRGVLALTPSAPDTSSYKRFLAEVEQRNYLEPFRLPKNPYIKVEIPPIYAGLAYDAVMAYARALTIALEKGASKTNGTAIFEELVGNSGKWESILGFSATLDANGDAEGNYTLLSSQATIDGTRLMLPVGTFRSSNGSIPDLKLNKEIDWILGSLPRDQPKCGFYNEHCQFRPSPKLIAFVSFSSCVFVVVLFFVFRHYRYEQKLACLLWKVDAKDIILPKTNSEYTLQNLRNTINFQGIDTTRYASFNASIEAITGPKHSDSLSSGGHDVESGARQAHSSSGIGFYKGNVVFMKRVYKKNIDLTRNIRKELIQVREMRHENINPFIGASVDAPNVCILTLYCARGSLEDVLKNKDLDLDNMFVASLVADLIKGMIYLHDSVLVSHGNLKSSSCLVDSRWVLQITDYGLHEFKAGQDLPAHVEQKSQRELLWRAPELQRMMNPPSRGTVKGDVYSFAIILYEIIGRQGPWGQTLLPIKCIVDRVVNPLAYEGQVYRPPTRVLKCPKYILRCMEDAWHEDPEIRPDFRYINIRLREMQSGLKLNIFDNMLALMQKYAYNLESLVAERTNQLVEEKKRTENLLLKLLPRPVAEQLKTGRPVEAESFDSVTIYFSDIVGFTSLSAISTPLQIVDMLNDLYTCFDSIIGNYDVYKVETIGDAYMVVSGLPIRNGDKHAGQVASMALHLLSAIQNFEIKHRPGERLKLRIGIHSGHCVAGVVGLKMPRYCLFGDTVNTASRMESTGEALKIHVSEACKGKLDKLGGYILQERGLTPIKGKGEMRTYWLVGKSKPSAGSLPICSGTPSEGSMLVSYVPSPMSKCLVAAQNIYDENESKPSPEKVVRRASLQRNDLNVYTTSPIKPVNGMSNGTHVLLTIEDTTPFLAPPSMSPSLSDSDIECNEEAVLQENLNARIKSKITNTQCNGYNYGLMKDHNRNVRKVIKMGSIKKKRSFSQTSIGSPAKTVADCC